MEEESTSALSLLNRAYSKEELQARKTHVQIGNAEIAATDTAIKEAVDAYIKELREQFGDWSGVPH
ncbi:MAG: hypothetical protein FWF71_06785 [Actinomycetia bacterium]|nr:hypothetical protein [Actinomycetes bacterium]